MVTFPTTRSAPPLDGRLLLLLSTDSTAEPRNQISDINETQLVFGRDVEGWAGGRIASVDARAKGYPVESLRDDSYAGNSANNGPYGDAIMQELVPEIERRFRGIGQGWARFTYGGSTGGWEAMAVQMFYPDEFNGAFIACPDPIDFR